MVNEYTIHSHRTLRLENLVMTEKNAPQGLLPEEATAVVWRIFGEGESPLKGRSSYMLIEPLIRKNIPSGKRDGAIAEIKSWFESYGDRHWLKSEMVEPVAVLILEGMKNERSDTAIWAAGSIEPHVAAPVIRTRWRPKEFDCFVNAALVALQKLCDKNRVLDPARCQRFVDQNSADGNVPNNSVMRPGKLETFQHLDGLGFELVYEGLQSVAGNLIDLIVDLRPDQFESLIDNLGHPVMQARAANRAIGRTRLKQHRKPLQWINEDAGDALVALAIVQTLNTVNRLDEDLRYSERNNTENYNWSTELRPPRDDLDLAAAGLMTGMIDRLGEFEPLPCARWVGELLGTAPYIVHRGNNDEIPKRIRQLEKACTELLGRLFRESWSDELKEKLCDGLQMTRRRTWSRHLAGIAWEIRDVEPQRAAEVSLAALDEAERQIAEQMKENRFFLHWNDWEYRDWIDNLGGALALSSEEIELPQWVSTRCRALPLSVWDAEESRQAFVCAERAAQLWFLVAFFGIQHLYQLGRSVDPTEVGKLAEMFWNHCDFAGLYVRSQPETSFVSEYVARFAVEYGKTSDTWILNQARNRGVGPRAMWALIHQREKKIARDGGTIVHYGNAITAELLRIASERFHNERRFNLDELRFWGQLWLLLEATNESEQTAIAITSLPKNLRERVDDLLVLKLLATAASKKELAPDKKSYARTLYHQLWPGTYTPYEERDDRARIDELFNRQEQAAN